MPTSGTFYLKYFDSRNQSFVESSDYFSFSKFTNLNNFDELILNPAQAFSAGLITSGQATGIGLPVIVVGGNPTIPSGPTYTYPITSGVPILPGASVPSIISGTVSIDQVHTSEAGNINGVSYIKVWLLTPTGQRASGQFQKITGYYWAVDANPLL